MRGLGWPLVAAVLSGALVASTAWAQEAGEPAEPAAAGAEGGGEATPPPAEGAATGEDAEAEAFLTGTEQAEIEAPEEEEGIGWEEPPDMRFWMVGIRYRTIFVPGWLLNAFFDFPGTESDQLSGPFIANHAAGVEFTTRKNNFSITGAVWWAGFWSAEAGQAYEPRAFLAMEEGDPTDPEYIESTISLLMFTADFVFSTMFTDWFGITYGAGLGVGINLGGEVIRTEAAVEGGEYVRCAGPGVPDGSYCEARGGADDGYYGTADTRVWPVYPWVNLLLGLRFKAFRHLEVNVDGGVGLGFLLGFRVNYIF